VREGILGLSRKKSVCAGGEYVKICFKNTAATKLWVVPHMAAYEVSRTKLSACPDNQRYRSRIILWGAVRADKKEIDSGTFYVSGIDRGTTARDNRRHPVEIPILWFNSIKAPS
jgi:hypothetical protein